MYAPGPLRRRRRWPIFVPLAAVVLLAAGWTALWSQAATRAETSIDAWRAREAQAGRVYTCGNRSVGGYPFRIEVRCTQASAELHNPGSEAALALGDVLVAAQVYDTSLLLGEFTGPMSMGEPGRAPSVIANWTLAQASVRGKPTNPERVSLVFENPSLDRIAGAVQDTEAAARSAALHGRMTSGSASDHPVVELALKLVGASARSVHPLAAQPFDADLEVTLRGLRNFAPKPWPDRLRELQAANGRLEITRLRLQQGDLLAVGAGSLGLTARGALDGQLQLSVVGLDKVLRTLNIDQFAEPAQGKSLGRALSALDKLMPGLGTIARQNAGPALAAGLSMIGRPVQVEGKNAFALPLRFNDGAVFLGPLPLGRTPLLF